MNVGISAHLRPAPQTLLREATGPFAPGSPTSDQDEGATALHSGLGPPDGAVVGACGRCVGQLWGDGARHGVGLVLFARARLAASLLLRALPALEVHVEVGDPEGLELPGVLIGRSPSWHRPTEEGGPALPSLEEEAGQGAAETDLSLNLMGSICQVFIDLNQQCPKSHLPTTQRCSKCSHLGRSSEVQRLSITDAVLWEPPANPPPLLTRGC
ncbi:hypothetical protein MC885_004775 [Smutsia gigantea]|nr:hypothetical protein MC885_004775 [Smutsia gigantea]